MNIYYIIYKTIHVNGKFYIGRHQTENLNDGYLGSGKWVSGIKDKSTLSREIIAEANSIKELYELEEYYIDLHWDDPLCMNMKKASVGLTSEDNFRNVASGTHNWLKRPDGSSVTSDRVKEGTHNFLTREDGTNVNTDRVVNGTNPFQTRPDGTNLQTDRVVNGTHHFLTRENGTSVSSDNAFRRVANGTHNFLQNKGSVACYNKDGEYKRIPKEQFDSQSGPKEDWEWVVIGSKEGKKRKIIRYPDICRILE